MIAKLIHKNDNWICSNCMMRQPTPLKANCWFCGNWFSNFEEISINNWQDIEKDKNKYQSEI